MLYLTHYWSLRARLLSGLVRGISGRALSKASFDSVVIFRGQGLPPMFQFFWAFNGILGENQDYCWPG